MSQEIIGVVDDDIYVLEVGGQILKKLEYRNMSFWVNSDLEVSDDKVASVKRVGVKIDIDHILRADELVEKVLEEQPRIVFIDTEMPEIRGYDAGRSIMEANDQIMVVGMSSNPRYVNAWANHGITRFIRKDDFLDEKFLTRYIRSLLER